MNDDANQVEIEASAMVLGVGYAGSLLGLILWMAG